GVRRRRGEHGRHRDRDRRDRGPRPGPRDLVQDDRCRAAGRLDGRGASGSVGTKLVPRGSGTGGSRSLQIGGSALYKTSELAVDKAKRLAAHLLEADVDDVVVHEGGRLGVAGAPATALSWAELAAVATDEAKLPEGMDPGLRAEMDFNQGSTSYP